MLGNSNISIENVGKTLGTSTGSLKTLCTHKNINKWSRWKPVARDVVSATDLTMRSARYGFKDYTLLELRDYILNSREHPTDTYIRPSRDFRLGDFRNYAHDAVQPFLNPKIEVVREDGKRKWEITLDVPSQPSGSVTVSDLRVGGIGRGMLGVMLIRWGGSEDDAVVMYDELSSGIIKVDASSMPNGAYWLSFFMYGGGGNYSPTDKVLSLQKVIPLDDCLLFYNWTGGYDIDIYWMRWSDNGVSGYEFHDGGRDFYASGRDKYIVDARPYSDVNTLPANWTLRCIFSGAPSGWYGDGRILAFAVEDIDSDEVLFGFKIVGGSLICGFWAAYSIDLLDGDGCFFEADLDEEDYIPIDESGRQKYAFQLHCHGTNRYEVDFGEVSYEKEDDFLWHPIVRSLFTSGINLPGQVNAHTPFTMWYGSGDYAQDLEVYGMDNDVYLFELKSNIN